jgi:ribonuclease D
MINANFERCSEAKLHRANQLRREAAGSISIGDQERQSMANHLYQNDLPDGLDLGPIVAIDCETMGLNPHRDRLCLIQMSGGDGNCHLVQVSKGQTAAPNLQRMLEDPNVLKLFHFGRFDIAALYHAFGVTTAPVYCTKIASKLVRTFTDRHGLKNLLQELLSVDISKFQQQSDWGADTLTEGQLNYAASDVLHLHQLREALNVMLEREGRSAFAQACFDFLPTRAKLDLAGWPDTDIFAH